MFTCLACLLPIFIHFHCIIIAKYLTVSCKVHVILYKIKKDDFLYMNDWLSVLHFIQIIQGCWNNFNKPVLPIHQDGNQTEKGKQYPINVRVLDEAPPTFRCGNREQWNEDIHRRRAKTHPELNVSHLGTVGNTNTSISSVWQMRTGFNQNGWVVRTCSDKSHTFFRTVSDFI